MKAAPMNNLRMLGIVSALLGGCSAQASFELGTSAELSSESSGSENASAGMPKRKPKHTTSSDELTAQRTNDQGLTQAPPAHHAPPPGPIAAAPTTPAPAAPAAPQAAAPSAEAPKAERHDHDRGHGNDADRHDEDNPGRAKPNKAGSDHDRGHGNDADRVDEDNPGNSKKKDKKK